MPSVMPGVPVVGDGDGETSKVVPTEVGGSSTVEEADVEAQLQDLEEVPSSLPSFLPFHLQPPFLSSLPFHIFSRFLTS